jgi:hypothetical protein
MIHRELGDEFKLKHKMGERISSEIVMTTTQSQFLLDMLVIMISSDGLVI